MVATARARASDEEGPTGAIERLSVRQEIVVVGAIAMFALVVRMLLLPRDGVINGDGVYYAVLADHFRNGDVLGGISGYWSPLYPVLVAVASIVFTDLEAAGRAVSIMAGAALIVPSYLLVRALFDRRTATVAASLVAVHPALIESSTWVMTEAVFTLLFVSVVLLGWTALQRGGRGLFVACGALFGLAYLTRPESIGFCLAFAVGVIVVGRWFGFESGWRTRANRAAITLGVTLLVAAPYVVLVHQQTGEWTISAKIETNTALGSTNSLALIDGGRTTTRDRGFGSPFDVPEAASVASFPTGDSREPVASETRSDSFVVRVARRFGNQVREYLPVVLPYPLLLVGLIGLVTAVGRRGWPGHTYLLSFVVLNVVGYSLAVTEIRYIYPLLPIALAYVAAGCWALAGAGAGLLRRDRPRSGLATGAVLALVLAGLALALTPRFRDRFEAPDLQNAALEEKAAGRWLHEHTASARPRIMASNATIAYYADGTNVFVPFASMPTTLDYARRRNIDYWVVSERRDDFLPQTLSPNDASAAGLRLVYVDDAHPGFHVWIYETPW